MALVRTIVELESDSSSPLEGEDQGEGLRKKLLLFIILCLLTTTGCSTHGLSSARANFLSGDFDNALLSLTDITNSKQDRVLCLMERGSINQAAHNYEASTKDWEEAVRTAEQLDYYSISKGATSFITSDNIKSFRGAPYERILLHAFAAKSYMALSMWDDAAVEARNIVYRTENLDGFPDDPYSHYLAGFCFEMIDDFDGAAYQYKVASRLSESFMINEHSGHITPSIASNTPPSGLSPQPSALSPELVCFVSLNPAQNKHGRRKHSGYWNYAEIYIDGKYAGRSYSLGNTQNLRVKTDEKLSVLRATKTATRIIMKEALANAIAQENEVLGELIRWILFSLEMPDNRRWETLPRDLQVARVPCPKDLKEYKLVFKSAGGHIIREEIITNPIKNRRTTYFSFYRGM